MLLLWGRGVELKTVYSNPSTNGTSTQATAAQVPPKRYADNDGSMTTNGDFYGIEFYAPPLIHRDLLTPTVFKQQPSRPAAYQLHREMPHPPQSHQQLQQQAQLLQQFQQQPQPQLQHQPQQQQHSTVPDTNPILMNPLFYDEPVTSRYPPQPRPVARVIKYTEPGPGGGLQLPLFAAEDEPLPESLSPGVQYAVHRKPVATVPAPPHYVLQRHTTPVQGPLHHYHHLHRPVHRRYPPHYGYGGDVRYTHLPVVYNVQAPPPLDPGEYDLVTRFNRLLKQRERDGQREEAEGEEEETTRPAKRKKKVKKRKKKKSAPPPPPRPPLIEDEIEEETEKPFDDDRHEQQQEEPSAEEQETQNIQTNEQLPEDMIIQEDQLQNVEQPDPMTEHFSEDLNFQDGGGERVEFQMHGMGGPESYKFGYDTGKGMNRQFRYEERDSNGHVRGHYGYRDNDGKLQMYNYTSHPQLGYNAQKVEIPET
ncbi:titin-like isoform X2 [Adelges cooleyi]|nr:titin-like isoform X2 [Adelges cooleyi]